MKKLIGLFLLTSILFLPACSSFFKLEIIVDNPSKDLLVLNFDGESYEIPSLSSITLHLVKGEHKISATVDGEEIYNETLSITNEGLLNPTKSIYVLHKELYLMDQTKYDGYAEKALNRKDHQVANKTYQDVDFEVFEEQSFIPKNWDFGMNEDLPEEIKTSNEKFEVISKLYRISDLEKTWGFYGDFDFTQTSDIELKHFLDSLAHDLELDTLQ